MIGKSLSEGQKGMAEFDENLQATFVEAVCAHLTILVARHALVNVAVICSSYDLNIMYSFLNHTIL